MGRLGHTPAASLLWEHVDDSYYVSKDACLGLLHLPCEDLRGAIAETLEKHEGSALFPEFLPVLAPKTKTRHGWTGSSHGARTAPRSTATAA